MSDLQDLIVKHTIKAYNQGFNDAVGKSENILDEHKAGLIKMSAIALQEGIKAERKRILSLLGEEHADLVALITAEDLCGNCEGNCCG